MKAFVYFIQHNFTLFIAHIQKLINYHTFNRIAVQQNNRQFLTLFSINLRIKFS